ncbi:thioesterase family protein [Pseudomonas soli]|uniref:thioesterase family protein n=1 Tax=Pseudomonas soli TaxID=1306993 RepID=UPI0028B033B1|nr:thioesterase family protein [Pseudomonas soli]
MNLYIRLLLAILRGFFKPPMALTETLQRTLRVWPNDIDINKHMNNGRYMTIVDLFMLELCLRAKILIPAFKLGWKPMLGGNLVVYKKQLSMFEQYTAEFSICCLVESWTYFQYTFFNRAGEVVVTGYSKGAWVGRKGLVANAVIAEKLKVEPTTAPMPEAIRKWLEAEAHVLGKA